MISPPSRVGIAQSIPISCLTTRSTGRSSGSPSTCTGRTTSGAIRRSSTVMAAKCTSTWDEFFVMGDKMKADGVLPLASGGQPWQDLLLFELVVLGKEG